MVVGGMGRGVGVFVDIKRMVGWLRVCCEHENNHIVSIDSQAMEILRFIEINPLSVVFCY